MIQQTPPDRMFDPLFPLTEAPRKHRPRWQLDSNTSSSRTQEPQGVVMGLKLTPCAGKKAPPYIWTGDAYLNATSTLLNHRNN
ncbi:hypothetical protein PoB_002419400 [Plakobranchus ocellatus]|uniref:Uncharacterized protein n=1 Tax=Plakobranchus ocellatus TaxID=259542 RepID=A0AAV3ZUU8_9GAST|nr:hypothetical protein PoB_002419400 [Plakobranchus ocellatus]